MKDIFLFICVVLILLFIFVMNRSYLEKFSSRDVENSWPQLYTANNVGELYKAQNIYPEKGMRDYYVGNYPDVVLPADVVG